MGIIGTRSLDKPIIGIGPLKEKNRERILNGIPAVTALEALRANSQDAAAKAIFEAHKADLGFGLLLKKYTTDVSQATPAMIQQAVDSTIPRVPPMFWSFRIMVGLGFLMLILFALAMWHSVKGTYLKQKWLLRWALWMLPAPWIAAELGWFVAEYGRQPWTIYGVLPTHLSVSTLSVESIYGSLAGFVGFYTVLLIIEMYLMVKYAKAGPASLGTGRYDGEQVQGAAGVQGGAS
jgi:cytochrome d ubiquinol oxidase subunit I